ncbi:hypothetical protein TNIN_120071 [Trichonephila inaurata madagascariensis]|uniref:Uncharacterized protein n=1 Tax=Trichonephila inaurata madagascariensis TaxID=2747483 RepID=A0A8X6WXQ7_9ARAC|nr:hypothetical protein TNIN_120071 [Trichonephila inaurata madagascariensis]
MPPLSVIVFPQIKRTTALCLGKPPLSFLNNREIFASFTISPPDGADNKLRCKMFEAPKDTSLRIECNCGTCLFEHTPWNC